MPAGLLPTPLGLFYGSMLLTLKSMDSNLASRRKGECFQVLFQTLSATIIKNFPVVALKGYLQHGVGNGSTELSAQHSTETHRSPLPFECILICVWFLSTVSFIDLLKVIPRHDMNVIQCKQIVLIDMVHQQSHGKSRWVRGGYHITNVPKSHFHWKIPIYKYCQVLKCQSNFYH